MNEQFAIEIEDLVWDKDITYMESVILWCEKHSYELESVALLIKSDPVLQSKIREEAESANLLKTKRGSCLPI